VAGDEGDGRSAGAAADGDVGSDSGSLTLPPRLQQVLVAGSTDSASNLGGSPGGASPRQPLLIDAQPSASSP
jgi:hypothetical protein